MTTYQIALFVHLLALLAATAASAIVHFAASRRAAAPTLRQSMEWGKLMGSTARVFPIAVIALIGTGGYMVAGHWTWSLGWVQAGLAGALVLFGSGAVIGARGAAEAKANVARLQTAGHDLPNDAAPDRVAAVLSEANTWLALSIVAVMTVKPALVGSVGVMAAAWAVGAYRGRAHGRARPVLDETSEAEAA